MVIRVRNNVTLGLFAAHGDIGLGFSPLWNNWYICKLEK